MPTPLHRLYRTKLALVAVLFMVAGVVLLLVAQRTTGDPEWQALAWVPTGGFGAAFLEFGLLAVLFGYLDREDAEVRAMRRLRTVFKEQAPALRDSLLTTFATDVDTLRRVASPETLDGLARNSLTIQLGNAELAHDVYDDIRQQVIRSGEQWRDVQVSVSLAPWTDGSDAGQGSMFEATIRWEYRTRLASAVQRFVCVSDLDEYRQALHDPTSALVWYFEPVAGLNAATPAAFELLEFMVNGKARPVRRGKKARSQSITVETKSSVDIEPKDVVVAYAVRVLVQRHSHVLQLDITKPAKGLRVRFAYGDCGIRYVNVLDSIASSEQPRISRSQPAAAKPVIELAFDGWVWPKSGVGFGWVLEEEIMRSSSKPHR